MQTNMQQLVDRAQAHAEFWKLLIPEECEMPPQRVFVMWASSFSDDIVERGIRRAGVKFLKGGLAPDSVGKYASGVMRNAARDQQQ